jgi:hypothetical protein
MPSELSLLDRSPAMQPERPATFVERGVAVPFTTPLLAAARLRGRHDSPPEVLLPGFGGRGVYVLDWEACIGLARPTLHDRQLWQRLAQRPRLSPATVRSAARATAAQGYAGRAAQAAAVAALQALGAARETVRRELARRLSELAGLPGFAGQLDLLAMSLAETGTGEMQGTRLAARVEALAGLEGMAMDAARNGADPGERQAALLVAAAARLTLQAIPAVLAPLQGLLCHLGAALLRGEPAVAQVALLAERPDWLLDGWDAIAALCSATPRASRLAVLREALPWLPLPPQEIETWCGPAPGWEAVALGCRRFAPRPVQPAEARAALVLRQEQLRAAAA